MVRGDIPVSPWKWAASDYQGKTISITVNYNNTSRALTSAQIVRQQGCLYGRIYFDEPDSGRDKVLTVADGATRNFTANQMRQQGLDTIEDVMALQITAGP